MFSRGDLSGENLTRMAGVFFQMMAELLEDLSNRQLASG